MRPVVVGIDPGGNDGGPLDPKFPSGKRLASLVGVPPDEFVRRFDRVNLHPVPWKVEGPSYDSVAGENLLPVLRGRRVIALGRRVSDALRVPYGVRSWVVAGPPGSQFVALPVPHPSGLNRDWNDPGTGEWVGGTLSRTRYPCIHVEGVDGSGKTTLVNDILKAADWPVAVPTDDPPKSWGECLTRVGIRIAPGVVCDRSSGLVSELVYGPVLRGGVLAPGGEEEVWDLVRAVAGAVTFVYCRPATGSLRPRFRPGEDPRHVEGVQGNLYRLQERYDEVMIRATREGCRVVTYDWESNTPEDLVRCVE